MNPPRRSATLAAPCFRRLRILITNYTNSPPHLACAITKKSKPILHPPEYPASLRSTAEESTVEGPDSVPQKSTKSCPVFHVLCGNRPHLKKGHTRASRCGSCGTCFLRISHPRDPATTISRVGGAMLS